MLIYPDVNARQADYQLDPNEALVTKIFYTVQGEGPLAGEPAIFVRLAGCNLGSKEMCPWCDTYFELKAGQRMRVADILTHAAELLPAGVTKRMVLTGGEPMLQNPFVLVEYFLNHGWQVQIETNGYFWPETMHDVAQRHREWLLTVVSPKVNARQVYPSLNPVLWQDSTCLKVVIEADPFSPYNQPPDYADKYFRDGKPVYISPINYYHQAPGDGPASFWDSTTFDHARSRDNYRYAYRLATERGWRVSLQTHLLLEAE